MNKLINKFINMVKENFNKQNGLSVSKGYFFADKRLAFLVYLIKYFIYSSKLFTERSERDILAVENDYSTNLRYKQ